MTNDSEEPLIVNMGKIDFHELGLTKARLTLEGLNDEGESFKLEVAHLSIERISQVWFDVKTDLGTDIRFSDEIDPVITAVEPRKDLLTLMIRDVEMMGDLDLRGQKLRVEYHDPNADSRGE